jgi:hypothetical protein
MFILSYKTFHSSNQQDKTNDFSHRGNVLI